MALGSCSIGVGVASEAKFTWFYFKIVTFLVLIKDYDTFYPVIT